MKYWAEFYWRNENGSFRRVLGSDGRRRLDARMSRPHMCDVAHDVCIERGFDGYHIVRQATLLNEPFYLTALVREV